MTENEFILADRIAKIKSINESYDLLNKGYLSFSGGKDSTVMHKLLDLALPDNKIPRLFIDTGIEYAAVVSFVQEMLKKDERIVSLKPTKNIKDTLQTYGYPFKSKEYAMLLASWKNGCRDNWLLNWVDGTAFERMPKILKYQLSDDFKLKISHKCCYKLKKEPASAWSKKHGRPITITGIRKEEGGNRKTLSCIVSHNNKLVKFHPLSVITEDWEDWFIKEYKIQLCKLYYPPYNYVRTGCKGCPFALHLHDDLDTMEKFFPKERKQCELIWKPVYDEYRRIGYRLKEKTEETKSSD